MPVRKTKRSDGRYQASVFLGYKDGKPQRKYFYGKSQREAKAKLDAFRKARTVLLSCRVIAVRSMRGIPARL